MSENKPVRPQIYNTRKKGTIGEERVSGEMPRRENEEDEKPEEEELEEGSVPRRLRDPRKPSQAEVDEHNIKHFPFREWCRHCLDGKRTEQSA